MSLKLSYCTDNCIYYQRTSLFSSICRMYLSLQQFPVSTIVEIFRKKPHRWNIHRKHLELDANKSRDVQYISIYVHVWKHFFFSSLIIKLIVSNETAIKLTGEENRTEPVCHRTLIFLFSFNYYTPSESLWRILFLDLCIKQLIRILSDTSNTKRADPSSMHIGRVFNACRAITSKPVQYLWLQQQLFICMPLKC